MENKIVKSCLVLWGMLFFGIAHGTISEKLKDKLSGISEVIWGAFASSELMEYVTAVLLFCAAMYIACRRCDNHHYSWNKLVLEVVTIEVLWLIPYDWKVSSVGIFPISLFHYGAILLMALIVVDAVRWLCNHNETRKETTDIPYTIDKSSFNKINEERAQYADNILKRLQAVENEADSYAIIVYGAWGAGKTVFLNYIEKELRNKRQEVLLFNPWKCQNLQQINSDFLGQLSGLLKKYDSSLEKPVLRYSEMLDSVGAPKGIEYVLSLFDGQDETLSELKDHIVESLSQIKVPIYILIDDLDRMDADEILAVIRLIRNTANFPYLKFLVASDRDYLLSRLNDKQISSDYLQKIFMSDFYLPSISLEYPCVDACREDVRKMTNDELVNGFFENLYDTNSAIIERALVNIRQAKRFARELVTDWDFAKNNRSGQQYDIWFNDYFWVELLKYTHLDCYQELEHNPLHYFDSRKSARYKVNMYVLKDKFNSKENQNRLEVQILQNIFHYKDDGSVSFRSMALVENYDKYFSYGKAPGHLSQSDYVSLLNQSGSMEDLKEMMAEMSVNEVLSMQHLIMMTTPQKLPLQLQTNYLNIFFALCSRLNSNVTDQLVKEKISIIFDHNKFAANIKAYLLEILKNASGNYHDVLTANSICRNLILRQDGERQPIFDKHLLKEIIIDNFKGYLSHHSCDASDIVRNGTSLNCIVSSSVLIYQITDKDDNFECSEYDCLVFDEIMEYFKQHKSHKLQVVTDFVSVYVPDDYPQSALYDAEENKQIEIKELFGSLDNFEKFKAECFVH